MDFVSSSPLFSTTLPFFQNFHINHSFFKIFIIIHFFFIWQYQKMSYIMNNTCILCPQFFVLYCISRKTVDTEYTYYSWCMTSTDIVKWRQNEWLWKFWKRNDLYENFEKRRGSREKGGGGNEIHAPCACGYLYRNDAYLKTDGVCQQDSVFYRELRFHRITQLIAMI